MLEFKMTDAELQKKIVETVKPRKSDRMSYQNLNLLYGVYDDENDLFVTLCYYLSDAIRRTGGPDEYRYAVVSKNESFVFPTDVRDLPGTRVNDIWRAIRLYDNFKERMAFKKQIEAKEGISFYDLNDSLINNIFEQTS